MNNATDKVHGLSAQCNRYTRPPWRGKATASQPSSSRGGALPKYTSYSKEPQLCKFCATVHNMKKEDCPAWGRTCKLCHELNHFPGSKKCPKNKVHTVITSSENEESDIHEWIGCVIIKDELDVVICVHASKPTDIFAEIIVNEKPVRFHVDSGASVNTLPMKYVRTSQFIPCNKTLQMWNNSEFKPVCTCRTIICNPKTNKSYSVELYVSDDSMMPLLGSRVAQHMKLITVNENQLKRVNTVTHVPVDPLITFKDMFNDELGVLLGEVHLEVDPTVTPVVSPARRVPVSMKPKLQQELKRLSSLGVIKSVDQPTEWGSQMAISMNKSGDVRVYIDPHPLNKALKREHYPLPVMEDLLPELSRAKCFSKVDLRSGYWHILLDEPSSLLTTFQTPFGRYRWCRLPFGTNVSSEIFQKRLHQALDGLEGVLCVADDIIVYGVGDTMSVAQISHDKRLNDLLQRCREMQIKLNKDKSEFRCSEVQFIGHLLTNQGLKPDPAKIEAVRKMPKPEDPEAVRRINGFVNYLAKLLPGLSDVMEPLRQLTHTDVEWQWTETHNKAFDKIKQLATQAPILTYYDPQKPLTIQCDASQSGLGSCLLQDEKQAVHSLMLRLDTRKSRKSYWQLYSHWRSSTSTLTDVTSLC